MSDAEHLIENAIMALERYPYEEAERYFMEAPINIMMSKDSGCPLNAVWEMAIYCDTTLRQDWKEKWEKEAERWIPVTERLPDVPGYVLVCDNTAKIRRILWYHDSNGWGVDDKLPNRYFGNASDWRRYSHWMPLPEVPKEVLNAKENSI